MYQTLENLQYDKLVTRLCTDEQLNQSLQHERISHSLNHSHGVRLSLCNLSERLDHTKQTSQISATVQSLNHLEFKFSHLLRLFLREVIGLSHLLFAFFYFSLLGILQSLLYIRFRLYFFLFKSRRFFKIFDRGTLLFKYN